MMVVVVFLATLVLVLALIVRAIPWFVVWSEKHRCRYDPFVLLDRYMAWVDRKSK